MNASKIKAILMEAEYGLRTVGFAVKELCDSLEVQETRIKALEDVNEQIIEKLTELSDDQKAFELATQSATGAAWDEILTRLAALEAAHEQVMIADHEQRFTHVETQDASAEQAEVLPVVECRWCCSVATRIMLDIESGGGAIFNAYPLCREHEREAISITGEPARLIIESIARAAKEAAK